MAVNRLTGFSGFDVEGTVKKLMDAEKMKLTRQQQSKQYKVWEQEAYRSVIDRFNSFKSEYFDTLKSDKNFKSASSFAKFTSSTLVNGVANTDVTVSASASIQNFNQTIEYVSELATKDTYNSQTLDFTAIQSGTLDFGASKPATFKATMSIGSTTKSIELDMSTITNKDEFGLAFKNQVSAQFGANVASGIDYSGTGIKIKSPGNTVTLLEQTGFETSLPWMGVASGTSTAGYASKAISDSSLLGINTSDLSTMTINGKSLTDMGVLQTDTIASMTKKINDSGIGVQISYDTLKDKFSLVSSKEGSSNSMALSASFISKMKVDVASRVEAKNAVLSLNGVEIIKDSNSFVVDGLQVTLNAKHLAGAGTINIGLKTDTTKIVDQIKGFIDVYNGLIKSIGDELVQKNYRDFKPLTDDQKKDMSEADITKWEAKSKSGVLKGKYEINAILDNMRLALSEKVEGVGLSLSDIGIDTTSNYQDRGKLVIKDELKLKTAIESKYSDVVKLFSSDSDKLYLDSANKAERYSESGLANRLYDIMQDATRTTPDNNGNRGTLVTSAGVINTTSSTQNILSKQIAEYDARITRLNEYLVEKENSYYAIFAKVESALSKMNAQSSMFSAQ